MLTEFKSEVVKNRLNIYGVVVIKDGIKIAEHHFIQEERRKLYSVIKSFTSTAVGIAIIEGYFYGATGMKLTINEFSRFGQLYLQEGFYNGKQLLIKE